MYDGSKLSLERGRGRMGKNLDGGFVSGAYVHGSGGEKRRKKVKKGGEGEGN